MDDVKPICNWPLDENGFANIKDMVQPPGGCRLPPGIRGWKSTVEPVDEFGHPSEGDEAKDHRCDHRDTAEWKAHHARAKVLHRSRIKEHKMEEQAQVPEVAAPSPVTKATVAVPAAPSADELAKIAANAGGGATGLLMAALAVAGGGGAIWKYLQSKQKASAKKDELAHEQRMKELELQADNQKRDDDKHGECKTARETLASKVTALDDRVGSLMFSLKETQSSLQELKASIESIQLGMNSLKADGFEPEEILERLDSLESKKNNNSKKKVRR